MFIFSPQLLMINAAWHEILRMMGTALMGMFGVAMFMQKFYMSRLNIIQQLLALAGGLLLIDPGLVTDIIGLGLIVLVIVWNRFQTKGKIIPIENVKPTAT
jgi:TRAP-type uncharacterized transport system fused permease subunit